MSMEIDQLPRVQSEHFISAAMRRTGKPPEMHRGRREWNLGSGPVSGSQIAESQMRRGNLEVGASENVAATGNSELSTGFRGDGGLLTIKGHNHKGHECARGKNRFLPAANQDNGRPISQ